MEEFPPQITALTYLKRVCIELGGKVTVKRAPRGITSLLRWGNKEQEDYKQIRMLELYDTVCAIPLETQEATE